MDARRLSRSITGLALAGVLVTGVAACGDDDEDGTAATGDEATTTTAAEEETEAATESETEGEGETASAASAEFCDGVVTFNQAVTQVDIPDDASPEQVKAVGEEVIPLWDDVRDNAPEDLADEIQPLSEAVDPLAEGDGSAFNEDATFETYLGFVDQAIDVPDEEETLVTGQLAVDRAGDVLGEITTVVHRCRPAPTAVQHQGGRIDLRQQRAKIRRHRHREQRPDRSRARATPAPADPPLAHRIMIADPPAQRRRRRRHPSGTTRRCRRSAGGSDRARPRSGSPQPTKCAHAR